MLASLHFQEKNFRADLAQPLDISIPLSLEIGAVNCFWAPPFAAEPVRAGSFVGSTKEGGPVNFMNVRLNPHGNGTHTECVGHISREPFLINDCLKNFHFTAKLVSVFPEKTANGDLVIFKNQLEKLLKPGDAQAAIIRTLPNGAEKKRLNYSGQNPPYFHHEAIEWLVECGFEHLLTDLPSVDREEDGGKLLAHKAWWKYPGPEIRQFSTITELIFAPDSVADGLFLLNLQIASFEIDASPSKPVLYALID